MKRIFDLLFSLILLILIIPLLIIIAIIITIFDGLPIFHWSKRIGKNCKIYLMPKFRTMSKNSPDVATHLLKNPKDYITKTGIYLRTYSLDELPQIFSVLKGDMSLVGPRPALYNQTDLINLRIKKNIINFRPGVTGWAQINGRDNLSVEEKSSLDKYYCDNSSLLFDIRIIFITIIRVIQKVGISH